MRRMYSEKELTEIIKQVSEAYIDELIEDGVFDTKINEYVDAYLDENPITPSDLDFSSIDFVAKTLKQLNPNASFTGEWTSTSNWSLDDIYTKLEEINNILYAVINVKLTRINEDGQIYSVASLPITLSNAIADAIYDMEGAKASATKSTPCVITGIKATAYAQVSGALPDLSSKNVVFSILNYYANNQILLALTGTGDNVSVGDVLYVSARIPLTLL